MLSSSPNYHQPATDHQVIRALSRTSQQDYYYPSNQTIEPFLAGGTNLAAASGAQPQPCTTRSAPPVIDNIRSATRKIFSSIDPRNNSNKNKNNPNYSKTERSNSISSTYNQNQNQNQTYQQQQQQQQPTNQQQQNQQHHHIRRPTSPSSTTDSIATRDSNSSHPLRSKLEVKLSNLTHRFNQRNIVINKQIDIHSQSNSQKNHPLLNHDHHRRNKLKSGSSSSSLSSFIEQSFVRALHHHPNNRTRAESPKKSPINPRLTSSRPPSPAPLPRTAPRTTPTTNPVLADRSTTDTSSSDHPPREESTATVTRWASKRNYYPSKRTPHTIYVPIEHHPPALFLTPPHLQPNSQSAITGSTRSSSTSSSRLEKRQSPTQIALSRLDEILRGHHRNENLAPDHHDLAYLNDQYKYQSIGGHHTNTNPFTATSPHPSHPHSSSQFSPILDLSASHSLSPPLRTRKKIPAKPAHAHRHSQSMSDPHTNHVMIDPETWKSISISPSKFHRQRALKAMD